LTKWNDGVGHRGIGEPRGERWVTSNENQKRRLDTKGLLAQEIEHPTEHAVIIETSLSEILEDHDGGEIMARPDMTITGTGRNVD
jgi:hypothetical protein